MDMAAYWARKFAEQCDRGSVILGIPDTTIFREAYEQIAGSKGEAEAVRAFNDLAMSTLCEPEEFDEDGEAGDSAVRQLLEKLRSSHDVVTIKDVLIEELRAENKTLAEGFEALQGAYLMAVKGRREFRKAFREERAKVQALETELSALKNLYPWDGK